MPERELVCIVCPNGCALKISIDENGAVTGVTGNQCARGKTYAEAEVTSPVRTLTALVRVDGGEFAMCPVRSNKTIAKNLVVKAAQEALKLTVQAPVQIGDVIAENFVNSGADLIATRAVEKI